MSTSSWITKEEFLALTRIHRFEELPDEDLSAYTDMILDYLCKQLENNTTTDIYWCPKCETYGAVLEVDEHHHRGIASCGHCQLAIVVFYGEGVQGNQSF